MAHRAPAQPADRAAHYRKGWSRTVRSRTGRYRTAWGALVSARTTGARRELADPLTRNGYALIANGGTTGLLGLAYWLLTARLYPAGVVGRATAAYVAMNLLAGFTALNFNGTLTRFIPQAGQHTRKLILRAYAVSVLSSAVLAAVFAATAGAWGPSYAELRGPVAGIVFTGCVMVWAVFTLQDSVLTGLRGAVWVFAENGLFGLVKLILLVALATALPGHAGIYVSWMLPVIVAVPLVNSLILRTLVPRHVAATRGVRPPTIRQVGRFLAGDYAGAIFLLASTSMVPVVVTTRVAAASTAYFYVAWVIAGIVDLIGISMGMSLTVEGAFDAASLAANCRKALRRMATMLLPCAAVLALFAHWWLRLFGPDYATYGTRVLELLAVAAVPKAVTEVYLGALRARNRASRVAVIQVVRAIALLGLTLVLTGTTGIAGAGEAAVAIQGVIAVAACLGLWRLMAGDRVLSTQKALEGLPAEVAVPAQEAVPGTGIVIGRGAMPGRWARFGRPQGRHRAGREAGAP